MATVSVYYTDDLQFNHVIKIPITFTVVLELPTTTTTRTDIVSQLLSVPFLALGIGVIIVLVVVAIYLRRRRRIHRLCLRCIGLRLHSTLDNQCASRSDSLLLEASQALLVLDRGHCSLLSRSAKRRRITLELR